MPSVEPFGERVKSLRRSLGLTQLELAFRAGVSERTIRNAEHDRPIRREYLDCIAAAMGVKIGDIARDPAQIASLLDWRRHREFVDRFAGNLVERGDVRELVSLVHPEFHFRGRYDTRLQRPDLFNREYIGPSGAKRLAEAACSFHQDVIQFEATCEAPRGDGNLVVIQGTTNIVLRNGARDVAWYLYVFEFDDHRIRHMDEFAGCLPITMRDDAEARPDLVYRSR